MSRVGRTEIVLRHSAVARFAASLPAGEGGIEIWSRPIAGARTALPHARPANRPIAQGDVVIHSLGLRIDGYWTGLERTRIVGSPDEAIARAFVAMYDAQSRAIDAIQPGIPAYRVHVVACGVIEEAGYSVCHRTDHGIGLRVHEAPSISNSEVVRLEPGMVLSIEPGIYLPG